MSTESDSVGETPEVVPEKADETAVDAGVTAEAEGTPTVDVPVVDVQQEAPAKEEEEATTSDTAGDDPDDLDEDPDMDVEPLELVEEEPEGEAAEKHWYILKVQVNREGTIRDALERRVKIEGLEPYVEEIVVPTEDIAEFTKSGKRKITKRKLYPGYIMVNMVINDDTWFAVRETPGIGDFTGSAGKPTPMDPREVERILRRDVDEDEETQVKTSIPFNIGDHVRVKEGNFQNFEGDVDKIDEAHGLITVVINIFNRPTPVEIQYWQIEKV
ncbi:MAG: transcription termination/antitermination protein NusG [Pirellulaceae bacterium]|nr:transcription termination/antitermination protein NusG [Pirellulaceae bacterium]MDP6718383.1 transcription termination/antitermination protein NusG [Pirellulaceae bacterium]